MRLQSIKQEAELESLRSYASQSKEQIKALEFNLAERSQLVENLHKTIETNNNSHEEKIVFLQMQANTARAKEDAATKEAITLKTKVEKLSSQVSVLQKSYEEKDMSVKSNSEIIVALQARLIEVEPELAQLKDRLREYERHLSASALLKIEQENLLSSLRKDLRQATDDKEVLITRLRELDDHKSRNETQSAKLTAVSEQLLALQTEVEDKNSLITRLRSEAQVSERNHAMKTAMLATCEAQLEAIKQDVVNKEKTLVETVTVVSNLQINLSACEAKLKDLSQEFRAKVAALEDEAARLKEQHYGAIVNINKDSSEKIEELKKDFAKKSSMARTLLSEREEEVRLLSNKIQTLQEEIESGAPSERKIFELAQVQSKRDAYRSLHR